MKELTIYHNPRCSKSRATLALIEASGISPNVVLYLEEPLSADAISVLLRQLGMTARDLVRRGEAAFSALGLSRDSSDAEILAAMVGEPKLIERPIVVCGDRAVLGRPPENVTQLLDG